MHPICSPFGTIPKPFGTKDEVKQEKNKDTIKSMVTKPKRPTVVKKVTCRGQAIAKRKTLNVGNSNISSSNIMPNSGRTHNTRPTNQKRLSPKPLRESRCNINYAKLNDGLEPSRSPSPKRSRREKPRPKPTGPSVMCEAAHAMSMNKKHRSETLKSVTPGNVCEIEKENELADLEKNNGLLRK